MTAQYGERVPQGASNYCYRHPDRQSFVLCQRCARTICGECQTPAPVGVICPECLAEARRAQPRVARAQRAASGVPYVTYGIIAICAVVYLLQWVTNGALTNAFLFAPVHAIPEVGMFEPWRMITSVFTHSTGFFLHILLNMYTLFVFGRLLEPMLGHLRFAVLFLVSGLAGSVGVLLWALVDYQSALQAVVGASGAIFGLMGAFLVIQRRLGGNTIQLLVLVGINLVIGFLPGMNISWQAHVGGLIGGALLGLVYVSTRRRDKQGLQSLLVVAVVALLILLSALPSLVL